MRSGEKPTEPDAKKKNPFEGVTAEKYSRMLKAYMSLEVPSVAKIAELAEVGQTMVKRAIKEGWPRLGLPPLGEATAVMADPLEVHAIMAGLGEHKKKITENLFGPLPGNASAPSVPAVQEAQARAAEAGMAARVSMSTSVRAARAVEALAEQIVSRIESGEIDLPEQIRPEHIYLLAKAADTAAGAVHRSLQTERLRNGQPETIVGQHIVALISDATPEELLQIATTGTIPPRLQGLPESPAKIPQAIEGQVLASTTTKQ